MSEGTVHYSVAGGIATVTFDRPEARNAMTWAMYGALATACDKIVSDDAVRVAVFRGAGGAFVAGTDIQQFTSFTGADDGIAYEKRIDAAIGQIEGIPKPVIAVVEGFAWGAGWRLRPLATSGSRRRARALACRLREHWAIAFRSAMWRGLWRVSGLAGPSAC